ncbi:hypothetical protein ACVIW2_000006 [Bradyrhizobium huanghuaihaiense]
MIGERLGFSRPLPGAASAAKAAYDRVVGKSPRLSFDTTRGGIELHVLNTEGEASIVGTIQASPPLRAFRRRSTVRRHQGSNAPGQWRKATRDIGPVAL